MTLGQKDAERDSEKRKTGFRARDNLKKRIENAERSKEVGFPY